jgi:hypothetical protein
MEWNPVEWMAIPWRSDNLSTGSSILGRKPLGCICQRAEQPSVAYLESIIFSLFGSNIMVKENTMVRSWIIMISELMQ